MKSTSYLLLVVLIVISSCKKETRTEIKIIPKSANTFSLAIDKTINDSTLLLKWTKFPGKNFKSYSLFRLSRTYKNGTFGGTNEEIKRFNSIDSITYYENKMPYSNQIQYILYGITDSVKTTLSASLVYNRPNVYLEALFSDILINKEKKLLYLINAETSDITLINYDTNRKLTNTRLTTGINYCALGTFEGNSELYVPTTEGWVLILDATTLAQKDKIYIGGEHVSSVVSVNDKLIVSSSDQSASGYNNAVKIYDRKSKKLLGRTGEWINTRLLYLENSSNEFLSITMNQIPVDLSYFRINAQGIPSGFKSDSYHGDHSLNPAIARSFPNGQRLITSEYGTVYTKNMVYERDLTLRYGSKRYADFAFNTDGSVIYAALSSERKIELISYPSLIQQKTITTRLWPSKIFTDGNSLICITKEQGYQYGQPVFFIEKFSL